MHASRANRGLERLEIVYNNSGFAVTIQVKQAIEGLLGGVHVGQGGLGGGASGGAALAGSGIEIGHFLNAVEGFDQGLHTQRESVLRRPPPEQTDCDSPLYASKYKPLRGYRCSGPGRRSSMGNLRG